MPISGFINWGDIKGESSGDVGWVELSSLQWGVSRGIGQPQGLATPSTVGGGYQSAVVHEPFTIIVRQDAASPKLYQALHQGTHIAFAIALTNSTKGTPTASPQTVRVPRAKVTDIKSYTGASKYVTVTITFSEYYFNGVRNGSIGSLKGTVATIVGVRFIGNGWQGVPNINNGLYQSSPSAMWDLKPGWRRA